MREIKFRGKRIDNGEWVFGDLIHRKIWKSKIFAIRIYDDGFDSYEEHEVTPETVGQFTGLHDKNGVEIYEGDIVKDGSGQINPIVFSNSTYWFNWLHLIDAIEPLTVIGNIHEQED